MKRILFLLLIMGLGLCARAQNALFKKYQNTKGVETVFISKEMLQTMDNDIQCGKISMHFAKGESAKIRKIDHMLILSCDNNAPLAHKIKDEAQRTYNKEGYKILLHVKQDDEVSSIYSKPRGKKNEFVLINYSATELTIINITGVITIKDFTTNSQ